MPISCRFAALLLGVSAALPAAAQSLTVAPHLASHMVVQHGAPAEFRGTARPGETVTVTFGPATASGRAGGDGLWRVVLPSLAQGQAGAVVVRAGSGATVRLEDVVAGDVWLCSGQSNMDLSITSAANPDRTVRETEGSPIRVLKIKRTGSVTPLRDIVPEIAWSRAGPNVMSGFSAACWHMAGAIRAGGVKTPIGLIQASWGGTTIEDWMPSQALATSGTDRQQIDWLTRYAADPTATLAAARRATDDWVARADPGSGTGGWSADAFDDRAWDRMAVPGQWERSGIPALRGYDGVMWFRTSVTLTAAQAARPARIELGRIDERDHAWINGVSIGSSLTAGDPRSYAIAAGVLRAGANTIAVRVIDEMGGGGFSSPAEALSITLEDETPIALAGDWRYRRGSEDSSWTQAPPPVPWSVPRGLTMAWNGMIAPLSGMRLRGIAWYQGESNTSRAAAYAATLEGWRSAWRGHFGDPALPVVLVQLHGYGPMAARPADAPWARLREVQRLATKSDPRTGLAVAIDLGIPGDIHPSHKDVVGLRMGNEALRVAYDIDRPAAPQPVSARRVKNGIAVTLSAADGGLLVYGAPEPTALELCDVKGACRFARGRVEGTSVIVLDDGGAADEIRYAWQGSPPVNLYARSGLPVTPFRIAVEGAAR